MNIFEKQNPTLIKKLQPVKQLMRETKEGKTLTRLRQELEEVIVKLKQIPDDLPQSKDSELSELLSGKTASEAINQSVQSHRDERSDLQRQRALLERAIDKATENYRSRETQVVQEGIAQLRPEIDGCIHETIQAFESLRSALQNMNSLFDCLNRNGFKESLRPLYLRILPLERIVLYGPPTTIHEHIEIRKEQLGRR